MKALVVDMCKEKLHSHEFVRPLRALLEEEGLSYQVVSYRDFGAVSLKGYRFILLSGTALADFDYLSYLSSFDSLKNFNGNVLGICAGMQVLCLVFGGVARKGVEIGLLKRTFPLSFLGLKGAEEVYFLHQQYVDVKEVSAFEQYTHGNITFAVSHKEKNFFGVLFHPEVRNKLAIKEFLRL